MSDVNLLMTLLEDLSKRVEALEKASQVSIGLGLATDVEAAANETRAQGREKRVQSLEHTRAVNEGNDHP